MPSGQPEAGVPARLSEVTPEMELVEARDWAIYWHERCGQRERQLAAMVEHAAELEVEILELYRKLTW
jgi:hypothetical protein